MPSYWKFLPIQALAQCWWVPTPPTIVPSPIKTFCMNQCVLGYYTDVIALAFISDEIILFNVSC